MAVAVAAASLAFAGPAIAQTPGSAPPPATTGTQLDPNSLALPSDPDVAPAPRVRTARHMGRIADAVPKVRRARSEHRGSTREVYLKGSDRWQVSYYAREERGRRGDEIAQVTLEDRSGKVTEAWTGFQVAWTMARGYEGAFGRKVNAPYVWLPLCLLFWLPFVDPRRPLRLLHLDLLVLLGFSVSYAYFNAAKIGTSVPLVYPLLAYLLARLLVLALRRGDGSRPPPEPLRLLVPVSWLVVGLIFLVGFRVGLNLVNSNVIDVGYSGVIGADRLMDGKRLYGTFPADDQHGDTYGPVNYYAYVPFEQALPWGGSWDDLPGAHAAAVAFDLGCLLLIFLLGRRIRGPTLGIVLAYAWAAYPFTLLVMNSNANDSLVALLILATLLVASSPAARGAGVALAGLTKFAPLALAPLLATYGGRHGPRRTLRPARLATFVAAFAVTLAIAMLPVLLDGGRSLEVFWERTLGFQGERGSPFSLWGQHGGLDGLQAAVQIAAAALAVAVALVPRGRDLVTLSALAGAVIVALQLGVTHWFYLYLVWFFPLAMIALLGPFAEPARAR